MPQLKPSFYVRIDEYSLLAEVAERVSGALHCPFSLYDNADHEEIPIMRSEVLGLSVSIAYGQKLPEGEINTKLFLDLPSDNELKTFRLQGSVLENRDQPWPDGIVDISEFVLGVLHRHDSPHWYIPSREQRMMENGMDPNDPKFHSKSAKEQN